MRFLLSIVLLLSLMNPLYTQDSTSFRKHLSVEGKFGAVLLKNGSDYNMKNQPGVHESEPPIRGNVNFDAGFNYDLGINYSFRPANQFKSNRNIGFLILGLNLNLSSFKFDYNFYDESTSAYTSSSSSKTKYSIHSITGTTTPLEIDFTAKYFFRAGKIFFGPNISFGKGTYFKTKVTSVDVEKTSINLNSSWTGYQYDTTNYIISLNNYFGSKTYKTINFGLTVGIRFANIILFTNEDLYYNSNTYRYARLKIGAIYLFN